MPELIRFTEISARVGRKPGYYEIYASNGELLKIGIARDLRDRLLRHRASYQSGLSAIGGIAKVNDPQQLRSSSSILAKHLFFDTCISPTRDLRSESGRRAFLEEECWISFELCESRKAAREMEKLRERTATIRYMGPVRIR